MKRSSVITLRRSEKPAELFCLNVRIDKAHRNASGQRTFLSFVKNQYQQM